MEEGKRDWLGAVPYGRLEPTREAKELLGDAARRPNYFNDAASSRPERK